MTRPEFDDLIGPEVVGAERERLWRAHEALVAAGPPPSLPAELARPPGARRDFRRPAAALALAAALAAAAFGGGWALRGEGDVHGFPVDFTLEMRGTAAAPAAHASLVLGHLDEAGNWPMEMTVQGLADLPAGERYELVLTRGGRPEASCGLFDTHGRTIVYLNAPYDLRRYDGWAIVREGSDELLLRTSRV